MYDEKRKDKIWDLQMVACSLNWRKNGGGHTWGLIWNEHGRKENDKTKRTPVIHNGHRPKKWLIIHVRADAIPTISGRRYWQKAAQPLTYHIFPSSCKKEQGFSSFSLQLLTEYLKQIKNFYPNPTIAPPRPSTPTINPE